MQENVILTSSLTPRARFKTILFLHIPKSGGMSLRHALSKNFADEEIYTVSGWTREEMARSVLKLKQTISQGQHMSLIMGHIGYGFHRQFGLSDKEVVYISVMREPIKRIFSLYKFIRHEKQHELHKKFRHSNFSQFIRSHEVIPSISNVQIRHFSPTKPGISSENLLSSIRRQVQEHKLIVGTLEQYDQTLEFFQKVLNIQLQNIEINQSKEINETVTKEDVSLLEEMNKTEIQLYRYIYDQLDEISPGI